MAYNLDKLSGNLINDLLVRIIDNAEIARYVSRTVASYFFGKKLPEKVRTFLLKLEKTPSYIR
jgi:hypothetical protein